VPVVIEDRSGTLCLYFQDQAYLINTDSVTVPAPHGARIAFDGRRSQDVLLCRWRYTLMDRRDYHSTGARVEWKREKCFMGCGVKALVPRAEA